MSLKEKINADIKQAMINKKQDELLALRAIKSAILLAETDKGATGDLSEELESKLLMKAAKQRKDSAEVFTDQGRDDLAQKELKELEVIERYLPKQLDRDQLEGELRTLIQELGASGPQDMGKVMGTATKKYAGRADGKTISEIVKSLLIS